jgi:tRNA A-37 threonylcarbamoyl transferase component Bud32/tetratricopeptide (TPR) repeat protein
MNSPREKICVVCHRSFGWDTEECPDDRVRLSEKDSRIGTIFDSKYEILDFIGAGGLSRVYKARHLELNRTLALKILKSSELIDLKRFRREAISIAQLEHPNIARVFSFAVAPNGCPYMALEFLDGSDLAEWVCRDGPLEPVRAAEVFEQVASALVHAHSRNVIHRDIKPGNIILLADPEHAGLVKVVDFGMARVYLEGGVISQRITQEGEIFGTRQYISPEQYKGVAADGRADIYALGVSMYESVLKDGQIPEMLAPVISKATASDPLARFQTAGELKEELSRIKELLASSHGVRGMGYVPAGFRSGGNLFEIFFFWSMLTGMIVVAVCTIIIIKQRSDVVESVSSHPHRSALGRVTALSLAATQKQVEALVAVGQLKEAVLIYEDWLKRNRNTGKWSAICEAEAKLAFLYSGLSDRESADRCVERGMETARRHGIKSGQEYVDLLVVRAAIAFMKEDFRTSIALSEQTIALGQGRESSQQVNAGLASFNNMTRCRLALHELEEAEKAARTGLELSLKSYGESSGEYAEACDVYSRVCADRKQYKQALAYIGRSMSYHRKDGLRGLAELLSATLTRAEIELKMNDPQAAELDYEYVVSQISKLKQSNPIMKKELNERLKGLARRLGKLAELEKLQT